MRYFEGNHVLPAIAVLVAYALAGLALLLVVDRRRAVAKSAPTPASRRGPALFAVNSMSSGHSPVAANMPFGVAGSSPLPKAAQGDLFSLGSPTTRTRRAPPRRWTGSDLRDAHRQRLAPPS